MARLFEITNEIRTIARSAISDMIDQLGKVCLLVYPPTWTACDCSTDPSATAGSNPNNRWITGGPAPAGQAGLCLACGGTGRKAEESATEAVTMLVSWGATEAFKKGAATFARNVPADLQTAAGSVSTKGYMADAPKILRARQMILQPDKEGLIRWRFELDGELADVSNVVPGYFFQANWKRVG